MIIGSLRGLLIDRLPGGEALVEVAGVGYRVQMPGRVGSRLGSLGSELFLHIHHLIREDHQALYGFLTREDRDCFETVLGARGVGPALALNLLSIHPPAELARILAEDDLDALCLVPGVGKKTAARLIVELKARFDVEVWRSASLPGAAGAGGDGIGDDGARVRVRQALAQLGYAPEEIRGALDGQTATEESELLRSALRRIAGDR
jgi:Holliday junction DNA helicase RuvA